MKRESTRNCDQIPMGGRSEDQREALWGVLRLLHRAPLPVEGWTRRFLLRGLHCFDGCTEGSAAASCRDVKLRNYPSPSTDADAPCQKEVQGGVVPNISLFSHNCQLPPEV